MVEYIHSEFLTAWTSSVLVDDRYAGVERMKRSRGRGGDAVGSRLLDFSR